MLFSKLAAITTLLGTVSMVAAHGYVSGIVVDGQYYSGYIVTQFPYESNPPAVIAWSTTATDLGYVDGTSYSSGDIICHKSAKPGALTAPVTAGSKIEFQWNTWPESHHGPVIDYLAPCNGNCSDVDKTTLEFFKIDQGGLVSDTTLPGTWASDQLISNNNSWTVTIPSTIAPGNYVLRHEIIALHSAGNKDGAQNYPQCINIQVTGSGTDSPSGTLGTSLYTDTDPGILINIYQTLSSYIIPGPTLYAGGSSSGSSSVAATSKATTSTAAASTATAKATTAKASTATSSTATVTTAVAKVTSSTATVTDATTVQTTTTKKVAAQTTATTATTVAAVTSAATSAATQAATTATTTASAALPTGSALTDYLNSLSADDVLTLIRGTMSWLITSKNHARDLSARAARAM